MEFLPAEYAWLQPVLIASVVVFVVAWIGNAIFSANNFVNALLIAIIFGLIFSALVYTGYGSIEISVNTSGDIGAPAIGTETEAPADSFSNN